jgi:redox-sensitive bicupin YhaK (pirin superfamily)
MIDIRKFDTLGAANHGWLDARHHFSFANYYDPARMGWGTIRVWNDDVIAPGSGFAPHSHRDMEIITYVRSGAITHKDSLGNVGRTAAGDVQVMGAGSGVTHSEYNLEDEETTLFQIWVHPRTPGGKPHWGMQAFPKADRADNWVVLASGYGEEGALTINADARVYGATLATDGLLSHNVAKGKSAYLVVSKGAIEVNGLHLDPRDGAAFSEGDYAIKSSEGAEIVMVETDGM